MVKNSAENDKGLNLFSILEKNYEIKPEDLTSLKEAVNNGECYFCNLKIKEGNDSVYLYFAPVKDSDWYMENILPSSFIKTNVLGLRNTLEKVCICIIIFLVIVASIIIIQQFYSRRIIKVNQLQLEEALKVAEEASSAKSSFLFNMSHDIRTPMNAILGYTDMGLRHVDDVELYKENLQKIKIAGGHLLSLINDILEMSRIEAGKMALSNKAIDIRTAISQITIMSQTLAMEKNIDYETIIGNITNPYIYADELHINEIIINIISNAVKYTPDGGKVRYTINQITDVCDGKVNFRFEISDTGYGMSEEFQQHLFESFSREENTTISKIEGTGLGLSIVKKIVDMTNGTIAVHSIKGKGSTFTVEIPFKILEEKDIEVFLSEQKESEQLISEMSFEGMRVLLAEDNEFNRDIASCILEEAGLIVEEAEDGEKAVNAVVEKGIDYYDFIIMDIQMPVLNGYQAVKKIRELPNGDKIPIIALSANAFEEDKQKSLSEGMNAHVAKPINVMELFETISSIL